MAEVDSGAVPIRWDVLTIGHLSRNRYWGEADDRAYRKPLCTSTLLRAAELTVVVDPPLPPEEMTRVLDERAGIVPGDVDMVFLTHFHGITEWVSQHSHTPSGAWPRERLSTGSSSSLPIALTGRYWTSCIQQARH